MGLGVSPLMRALYPDFLLEPNDIHVEVSHIIIIGC